MPDQRSIDVQVPHDAPMPSANDASAADAPVYADAFDQNLNHELLRLLEDTALSPVRADFHAVTMRAISDGFAAEDLIDDYIPAVARKLGNRWCEDTLGFAQVTIGVSRLQAMLRKIGEGWTNDSDLRPSAPSIMLIVQQDIYHTLGAMVLNSQLRRMGLSVRLMLGECAEELARQLNRTNFSAVFISSSCGETLHSLSRTVDVVKTSTLRAPPIVIGGTILDVETTENVTTLTGADYATKILGEALELCGLAKTPLGQLQSMREL